mgnify:CR=1 FL=1
MIGLKPKKEQLYKVNKDIWAANSDLPMPLHIILKINGKNQI